MANETPAYKRLPGKKRGFFIGHHTLWQASDHLLQIYSRLGVEDYKRYYFDDIQAIITRKSGSGRIQNIILGAIFGLFCFFAVASGGSWRLLPAIIAAAILLILLINVLRGPTCETVLLTAVQTEKLYPLHRLKTTEPVMNRLRSIIEQRQGRINPAVFDQQPVFPSTRRTERPVGVTDRHGLKDQKHERGRVHLYLFAFLVVDGLIVAAGFMLSHVALTLLGSAITMLLGIFVVVALVKQHESNLKRSLRTLTWAALGYVGFSFLAGYIVSMGIAFRHPEIMRNQWELFKLLSRTTPWESPLLMTVNIIAISGAAFIGILGLFLLRNPHQANHQPSTLPTSSVNTAAVKRMP